MSQTENSGQTSGRRFSSKHLLAVALAALAIGAGAVYASVSLSYHPITVQTTEPLSLSQSSETFTALAGETIQFNLTVSNVANNPVPATLSWTSTNDTFLSLAATNGTSTRGLPESGLLYTVPKATYSTVPFFGSGSGLVTAGALTWTITATISTSAPVGTHTFTIQFTLTR